MTDRLRAALDELAEALLEAVGAEPADAPTELLSVQKAAERLSVGRTLLYSEMASGRLRSVKAGRRRLIPSSALAEYQSRDAD